jgi:hypothetical protein
MPSSKLRLYSLFGENQHFITSTWILCIMVSKTQKPKKPLSFFLTNNYIKAKYQYIIERINDLFCISRALKFPPYLKGMSIENDSPLAFCYNVHSIKAEMLYWILQVYVYRLY